MHVRAHWGNIYVCTYVLCLQDQLNDIVDLMKPAKGVKQGEDLIRQGDRHGREFYVVEKGQRLRRRGRTAAALWDGAAR